VHQQHLGSLGLTFLLFAALSPAICTAATPAAPKYDTVQRLPGAVTLATLSNGLTVIVQENHVAPVATVRCYVKNTGGAFEGRYLGAGLSHLVEHLVAGGTTATRGEKEIERIIDTFGGATNAYTSSHLTAYFIDCPARNTMAAIELLSDSMQHAKLTEEEFAREFKVVQRELADGDVNRKRVQWKLLDKTVYTRHPVRHPVIGYLDVLRKIDRQAALDFHGRRYVPNNQVFVVVGDVKTQAVLDRIAQDWATTPRGRETYVAMEDEPRQLTPRSAVREMDGTTCDMALAWPTVKLSHSDLYALDVAAYILGEGESSRLVRSLKYDKQLVLSVSSASYTPHFVKGWFGVFASCTPKHRQQAAAEVLEQVYRLRGELVSPAELAKAKKQKAAELVFGQQTIQQAAGSLGRNYISTGDPLFDNGYVENIQKVTAEQIRAVARRYFVPDRLNRVTISPPGKASKSAGPDATADESPIRMVRLPNGLRVLVKRHAQLPLVNIQAYVLGGSLVDDESTAGRSALVGAMTTSTRSAGGSRCRPAGTRSTAARPRCVTTSPGRRRCLPSASRNPRFRTISWPRYESWPWAPSPDAPTARTRRPSSSSTTTCRPRRRTTCFEAARRRRSGGFRPPTCAPTTESTSYPITWSSPSSATSTRTPPCG